MDVGAIQASHVQLQFQKALLDLLPGSSVGYLVGKVTEDRRANQKHALGHHMDPGLHRVHRKTPVGQFGLKPDQKLPALVLGGDVGFG